MSDNLIKQFNNETLNNNLNQKDLNVLPSNEIMSLNREINKIVQKLDEIFVKLLSNEEYKDNYDLLSLKSKYSSIREKYIIYIKNKEYSEFINIKAKLEEISSNIVSLTTNNKQIQEPIIDKVEPKSIVEEETIEDNSSNLEQGLDNSLRKKEITDDIKKCNININTIQNIILEFESDLKRKERYLSTNKPYLDSIEIYGFEKAIQNTKQKIENQKKLLEQETMKLKKKVSELNELNDIEMAPTEVFNNIKEQIELLKEKEKIETQIASLQNKVPENYYSEMISNSKKTNL